MACQYPIYIESNSDRRKSKSNCGGGNWLSTNIFVGSSSHHSLKIGELQIDRYIMNSNPDIMVFTVLFNEKVLKIQYFNTKTKQFYKRKPKDVTN